MIKHNCCKDNDFEWKEISLKDYDDSIVCKNCGRIFREIK